MKYIISDKTNTNEIVVRCIKSGSYTVLTVEYNDKNKVEILKMVLDYVARLENNIDNK
jgi:hypothetical protein